MSALTIRLPDKIANEVKRQSNRLQISRSEYIRRSVQNMNKMLYEQEKRNKLRKASNRVRKGSMSVNLEFSKIEHDPET